MSAGATKTLIVGPDNINAVWESHIDAHNSRDIEGIRNLNADNFSAYGPAGEDMIIQIT